ncbi:MAG TPA: hypothetical protein VJT73_13465, partial [Polyangiaceae bacterium]|nr:hypothetical protein [Polyangiaceae bacterium]
MSHTESRGNSAEPQSGAPSLWERARSSAATWGLVPPHSHGTSGAERTPHQTGWDFGGAALGALVGLAGLLHIAYYARPFEDAYITFRYARNVANGLGVVYNAGERVEGCTSLAWTLLLAGLSRVGASLPSAGTALSVSSGALLLVATACAARMASPLRVFPKGSAPPRRAMLLAPTLVACNGTFAYYSGTGMETTLFALLVLASVMLAATPTRDAPAGIALGLVLAGAASTRPEGTGYAFAMLLALALRRKARLRASVAALAFVIPFAALSIARYHYFGDLLPNTYYAKA